MFSLTANPALHWLAPLHPTPKFQAFGFDERLYRGYVSVLILRGIGVYPQLARQYVQEQTDRDSAILASDAFFLHRRRLCLASHLGDRAP